ncbi:3656_t:CDS:2 [Ambispora leptoticha]|uniref:3656_t:CDS:1 n=1 Tax=Ambispora leptoticha TaxID=144679 RepID=A0A9N8ZEN5_9GLOM|nr:3656_t:CDS:2 [Ambispora leptoticha]
MFSNLEGPLPSAMRGKHLLVLGAYSRLGSQVVCQALEASYHVTALVQTDKSLPFTRAQLQNPNLVICVGSTLSRKDLEKVVEGKDAIINCLYPSNKPWKNNNPNLLSTTQKLLNEVMIAHGVKRLIVVRLKTEGLTVNKSWSWIFTENKTQNDKEQQEKLIMENSENIDWTIINVGKLSNGKLTENYSLEGDEGEANKAVQKKISRADVAHFILQEIGFGKWIKRTPLIHGEE